MCPRAASPCVSSRSDHWRSILTTPGPGSAVIARIPPEADGGSGDFEPRAKRDSKSFRSALGGGRARRQGKMQPGSDLTLQLQFALRRLNSQVLVREVPGSEITFEIADIGLADRSRLRHLLLAQTHSPRPRHARRPRRICKPVAAIAGIFLRSDFHPRFKNSLPPPAIQTLDPCVLKPRWTKRAID